MTAGSRIIGSAAISAMLCLASVGNAQLNPEWNARYPLGGYLGARLAGVVVDDSGVTYVTSTASPAHYSDIITAAFDTNGTLLWTHAFNGSMDWYDTAAGITLAPDGTLWVCGSTPGQTFRAKVLALQYDTSTGDLLNSIEYSGDPFFAEYGARIAADPQGNIYIAGGTGGDGPDVFVLSFDPNGALRWRRTWDGPARAPYSLDQLAQFALDPNGDVVVLIKGVMANLRSDYVIVKYARDTGATIWEKNWGTDGEDLPLKMEIDAGGDIFVSGTAVSVAEGRSRFGTIRLRGSDGQLIWENFSGRDYHNHQEGLAIDGRGGVYVTGSVDPNGDISKFTDNFYSVKLDAETGVEQWSHSYGDDCIGCFDIPGDIEVDTAGNVFVAGRTSSAPYSNDMILLVLDSNSGLETDRGVFESLPDESSTPDLIRLDIAQNILIGGNAYGLNSGLRNLMVTKFHSLTGNLYALTVQNLVGGEDATFTIANATPNVNQYIIYSLRGLGSTFVPQLNVTLDLRSPVLLTSGRADGQGTFQATVHVPQAATGRTVWFQGAELNRTSNVLDEVVR